MYLIKQRIRAHLFVNFALYKYLIIIIYVRGDFRRVLPSIISINNHKCRGMHQSQELACRRCRFLGHTANNSVCDAFYDESNGIAICPPKKKRM